MSKTVISKTTELTNLRRKYRRSNVVWSFLLGLLVLVLYFAYVFVACAIKGYGGEKPLFDVGSSWLKDVFIYFDTTRKITDVFDSSLRNNDLLYRCYVLAGAVVLAIVIAWIYGVAHGRHLVKKYASKYKKALLEEVRINGLTLETQVTDLDENSIKQALTRTNVIKPVPSSAINLSSPSISWNGIQYSYSYNNKSRNGFLIQTTLSRSRTGGLIQFRTFGRPTMTEYEGNEIRKYGFAENPKMSEYVCYTSLGQDIYTAIDSTVVDALYDFKQYVGCGIVVTLAGQSLAIFVDGFKLNLYRTLKDKLEPDFVEKQVAAIAALHKCVGAITNAFSADLFVVQGDDKAI